MSTLDQYLNASAENITCKFCQSVNVKRRGVRPTKNGGIQRYYCLSCGKRFTKRLYAGHHTPDEIIKLALEFAETKNAREISEEIRKKFAVCINMTTIYRWIKHTNQSSRPRERARRYLSKQNYSRTITLRRRSRQSIEPILLPSRRTAPTGSQIWAWHNRSVYSFRDNSLQTI